MVKETIVISLGGSLIVPDKVDYKFLKGFKKIINKNKKKYGFIIVTGGGNTARNYIKALKKLNIGEHFQSLMGISATRTNARLLTYLFGKSSNENLPSSMKEIKNLLKKNNPVICGALRYEKNETTDATAAKLARYFKSKFVNLTKVKGLYNKNPKKKNAKFIPEISWKDFKKMTPKKFKPGQHFVLDQKAARIIEKNKIKTYILGKKIGNLNKFLSGKKFTGTIIS
jgi:uridylate kinase